MLGMKDSTAPAYYRLPERPIKMSAAEPVFAVCIGSGTQILGLLMQIRMKAP